MVLDIILVIIVLLIIFFVNVAVYDTNRFVVKEYTYKSSKIDEDADFLFVSDLHAKEYGKDNAKLFAEIDKYKFDGALLAGDIITCKRNANIGSSVHFLEELSKRMPVYYGIGNHELRFIDTKFLADIRDRFIETIGKSGVSMMNNETKTFGNIAVTGLSIDYFLYDRAIRVPMFKGYMESKIGKLDTDKFNILLAHNPEYLDAYSKAGADLVLSGHYHGGIMRLPYLGGVISPRLKLFPKICVGEYKKDNTTMLVSAGLGMHSHSFRVFNPAEIIIIHLKKD